MPVARYAIAAAARGLRAVLNLEAGLVRDDVARPTRRSKEPAGHGELVRLRELLAEKEREISTLRAAADGAGGGVRPENIVWIFGTGRSGNTWLADMMEEAGCAVWREPSVGRLFGDFYYLRSRPGQLGTGNYVLGEKHRPTWSQAIRTFVLDSAGGRFPDLKDGYLVVKEQVGSVGAPLLLGALPESRVVLLVRDPRDVVASWLDGTRGGGWRRGRLSADDPHAVLADVDPNAFVRERAEAYTLNVGNAKRAYEAHEGPKVVVRYEDLASDVLGEMRRLRSTLDLAIPDEDFAGAVEEHAWENVPAESKGKGKFRRKATPGGWREDLTPGQVEVIERITAPLLEEFYPTPS